MAEVYGRPLEVVRWHSASITTQATTDLVAASSTHELHVMALVLSFVDFAIATVVAESASSGIARHAGVVTNPELVLQPGANAWLVVPVGKKLQIATGPVGAAPQCRCSGWGYRIRP